MNKSDSKSSQNLFQNELDFQNMGSLQFFIQYRRNYDSKTIQSKVKNLFKSDPNLFNVKIYPPLQIFIKDEHNFDSQSTRIFQKEQENREYQYLSKFLAQYNTTWQECIKKYRITQRTIQDHKKNFPHIELMNQSQTKDLKECLRQQTKLAEEKGRKLLDLLISRMEERKMLLQKTEKITQIYKEQRIKNEYLRNIINKQDEIIHRKNIQYDETKGQNQELSSIINRQQDTADGQYYNLVDSEIRKMSQSLDSMVKELERHERSRRRCC